MRNVETIEVVSFVDDIDKTEAKEGESAGTIRFVNQAGYLREVDLIGDRYDEAFGLLDYLEPYSRNADPDTLRRGRPRKASSGTRAPSGTRKETAAIRDWAREQGHAVSDRGALPKHIREAWENAGRPGAEDVAS